MKSFSPAAKAALAGACLSVAPVATAQEVVTTRVSSAGLDTGTAAGRAAFHARVAAAAARACAAASLRAADLAGSANCMREMRLDADAKLAEQAGADVAVAGR